MNRRVLDPPEPALCMHCGRGRAECRLIAGPSVSVCADCAPHLRDLPSANTTECSFCGDAGARAERVVRSHEHTICSDCLDLVDEIVSGAV